MFFRYEDDQVKARPAGGKPALLLVALLVLAALLRLYDLNDGLWHDEIIAAVNYVRLPFTEILTKYDSENEHFLYTILAHGSVSLFGEKAWTLRLPAVLFGIASIWTVYLLGRQVSSVTEALLPSALLSFSYYHIWFSQNARGYTGLLFFTNLSSWLFVRALLENRPKLWMAYAIAIALGTYTQLTMVFVFAGHFLIYLIQLRGIQTARWKGLLYGFLLSGSFTLLLYAPILPQMFTALGEESTVQMWKKPLWTLLEFTKGMQTSFSSSVAAIAALAIFACGFWSFARSNTLVLQLLLLPAIIGTAVVLGMGHPLWPRFFFFDLGLATIVFVRGTMAIGEIGSKFLKGNIEPVRLGVAICVCLILLSCAAIPSVYAPKQDFLGARLFVEQNKEPEDAVVIVGRASVAYNEFYGTGWPQIATLKDLTEIRANTKRIWAVYMFPLDAQALYPEVMLLVERDFKIVKTFDGTVNGGTIFVRLLEM